MRRVEDPLCLGGDTEPQTRSAGSLGFVEVTVRLLDGRQQTLRIDTPPGSPQRPLSWTDLNEKFIDCARHAGLDESRIPKLFDAWRELPDEPRVQPLVDLLIQE
jgi:2-methylcitrate dehydratase PrpD